MEVLEEAGKAYYYSTKTGEQDITQHHGHRIDGAMDAEAMQAFCREHDIRLMVDAAHPFASQLHQTIAQVSESLNIPAIRYERIYPLRNPDITWIDDYSQVPRDIHSLLATTGVQSIAKLKPLEEEGIRVYYRILNRDSSIALALKQGASQEQLCYFDAPQVIPIKADAILLKESGTSGGFTEKVEAAKACGMRIIALKRPELSAIFTIVNGPYGLRRTVEKLLPEFYPLHSGLTVTNGIEVRAIVESTLRHGERDMITIEGGEGVGTFTLPGFDYPPGEAAINKAPREMIRHNLESILSLLTTPLSPLSVTISVPQGAEIARRTFNPRLGIEGGISIIGVSGIVKPFSEEAFIDSIRKCMTVAQASGSERVVINSGGKSERFVKALYQNLPQQAFVEYGNYIGETLKIANELGFKYVTLGVMLGKAVKLAAGHLDTHSRKTTMDKAFIQQMLEESGCAIDISNITLARELWAMVPSDKVNTFASTIIRHCAEHCNPLLPNGSLTILLIDDEGTIYE